MITIDTSGIIALLDPADPAHERVVASLRQQQRPYLVPAATLGEIGYFLEVRYGHRVMERFLDDLASGTFELDCGEGDEPRVRTLVGRYADLPLGLVDAAVIACAERSGGLVLTLDQRDFSVVAREVPLTLVPALP